jgi:hypothetical protein
MGATLTTVNALSKEVYGPRVIEQLENEIVVTKRMEKSSEGVSEDVGGKYVTFPLRVRRNAGIGYRNENEALQAAGQQGWVSVRVPLRYGYGRVRMTGQTMELVETNAQAFANAMDEEMTGLKDDIKKDVNRILWGNGLGVLATVAGVNAIGVTAIDLGALAFEDTKYIDMDMVIDILDVTGAVVKVAGATVTGINEATSVITINPGLTAATVAGDIVVRQGNFGREPNGLTSLVSNAAGAIQNLTPAAEPEWQSRVTASGGALAESAMIAMCDGLRQKGGRPSVIFSDLGSRRAYFNLLTTQRRFTETKEFQGGFRGMTFSYDEDIPLVTDVDAPAGKMWFIKEDMFTLYQSQDWHWEEKGGGTWKWVTGFDAFEALFKKYWELGIKRRNVQGVLTGITPG